METRLLFRTKKRVYLSFKLTNGSGPLQSHTIQIICIRDFKYEKTESLPKIRDIKKNRWNNF